MPREILDFEQPIIDLEEAIAELEQARDPQYVDRIRAYQKKLTKLYAETFSSLSAWQRTRLARHKDRPYTLDYIAQIMTSFVELHGDRLFRDDPAVVVGLAVFRGRKVVIVGQQKGRDVKERIFRNFGMSHPEGYRKALRAVKMAAKFKKPVICFVDTPAAYPGIGAEERGQAEAIARNIYEMSILRTPILVAVTGEGGSGGALGIGVGDKILMQENAIYSVIPPEGCAAILFRDGKRGAEAAEALRITAHELKQLGIIDEVVKEPLGGAHKDPELAASMLGERLQAGLDEICSLALDELLEARFRKFRSMGRFIERTGEKSS
ncbi:MAG: acetyl-CoA carboxylase carboxyltransferase subunit alpha [Candidatus Coatesbacteria bacterium]|nr:acetyl-CoA carboxylase carboxyltransferase subunit alpha [Candidatus Coatesbacteria bacterium]